MFSVFLQKYCLKYYVKLKCSQKVQLSTKLKLSLAKFEFRQTQVIANAKGMLQTFYKSVDCYHKSIAEKTTSFLYEIEF